MELIRFAVWGMGIRGKRLAEILGPKIVCIIERDSQLHNTRFKNIPVISFKEYRKTYREYPVIITPLDSEGEIRDELLRQGITNLFLYSENSHIFEGFRKGGAADRLSEQCDPAGEIVIYGAGILGCLLYNHLTEKGFFCRLALQNSDKWNFAGKIRTTPWKREAVHGAMALLTVPLTEEDKAEAYSMDIKQEKCYETFQQHLRQSCYNRSLERFKGIHDGKRCFIAATGPSLRIEDLDTLHRNKEICFSVNGIFAAFEKTNWRPDYYMAGDRGVILKWKEEIKKERAGIKFIADDAAEIFHGESGEICKWHVFRNWTEGKLPQFSDDFARGTFTGWTITYDGPLQLAAYMGFREIYLLGADCSYIRGGYRNHFAEDTKPDMKNYHEERMVLAYRAAERYARCHDIRIYNATRGGMLEEFERVDFDSLFQS